MESPVKDKLIAVAGNVRDQRILKNYSKGYVADRLGMSQNAYDGIECGYTKVTVERLCEIAAILDTSIDELLSVPAK